MTSFIILAVVDDCHDEVVIERGVHAATTATSDNHNTAEPSVARKVNDNYCGGGGGDQKRCWHRHVVERKRDNNASTTAVNKASEPRGEGAVTPDD